MAVSSQSLAQLGCVSNHMRMYAPRSHVSNSPSILGGSARRVRVRSAAIGRSARVGQRTRVVECAASYSDVASEAGTAIIDQLALTDVQGLQLQEFLDSPLNVAVAAVAVSYTILLHPGMLAGYFDYLVARPIQAVTSPKFKVSDFDLSEQLGKGNFGTVFQSYYVKGGSFTSVSAESLKRDRVVVKLVNDVPGESVRKDFLKRGTMARGAAETGIAEGYCNSLVARAAPGSCAQFQGEFIADENRGKFKKGSQYLVWKYESDVTLEDFIDNRVLGKYPQNLADIIGDKRDCDLESNEQTAVVTQKVIRSMMQSLKRIHATGIVHRDVKPSNLIITVNKSIKFIDLGAATDLRTGINFNPRAGMLDPEYAPPEELVVPETTPRAPPPLVAISVSPIFWLQTSPDLFDTFSVGMIMIQMMIPQCRTFTGLRAFKREISMVDYDLDEWRASNYPMAKKVDLSILDFDNGAGWDLVKKLVTVRTPFTNRGRLSAREALDHRFMRGRAY